jgi:hypothetical protein
LYVDDILLASSDMSLLKESKKILLNNFEMKNMGEINYVMGIEIKRTEREVIWVCHREIIFPEFIG